MSGEVERQKEAAILWSSALAVLAANAGLAATALAMTAATDTATWQAVGVQAVLAACAQGFLLHGLRQGAAVRTIGRDGLFWTLVVPVLLYGFGAGIALIAGIQRLAAPAAAQAPDLAGYPFALAVLVSAASVMVVVLWSLLKKRGQPNISERDRAPWLTLTVQTAAGLAGILLATAAFMLWLRESPDTDAYGAALVALLMAAVAARLSLEIRAALRAVPDTAADPGPILKDHASPITLETKSMPLNPEVFGAPASEAKRPAAAEPPAKPGQKPPVVARRSAKPKRR